MLWRSLWTTWKPFLKWKRPKELSKAVRGCHFGDLVRFLGFWGSLWETIWDQKSEFFSDSIFDELLVNFWVGAGGRGGLPLSLKNLRNWGTASVELARPSHPAGWGRILKAPPLPPAPLATSWLLICRSEGSAGFQRFAGLKALENSVIRNIFPSRLDSFCFSNCQLVPVGSRSDLLIFRGLGGPFFEHFGVLGHYFNTILVTIGCKGSLRRDLECSRVEFHRFSMDLGSPIGDHSGSLFDILFDLKCPKSHLDRRHPLWWFLNWTPCDLWCPHLSKVR